MQIDATNDACNLPRVYRTAPHYALLRAALRLGARLSDGLALGCTHGFDSGPMLDYVYRNQPAGRTIIGRLIDRCYLNQIGWRAIRARKALLQDYLRIILRARMADQQPTHVLDVASGPGRYLIELLLDLGSENIWISCRDIDPSALQHGRRLASNCGLSSRVRYEHGDATDPADLTRIGLTPNIVVVSGLYEILTDDALICRSLRSIYTLLPPGGVLLFTTQVRHPQLALIANVLSNRNGAPWVMGTRSLARVERWAREAGFRNVGSELEQYGMFGVTRCVV